MKQRHQEAEKLFRNIVKHSYEELAHTISFGKELPVHPSKDEKSEWVAFICKELEKQFNENTIKRIRMDCFCTEGGKLHENIIFIKKIYDASSSLQDFVNRINEHSVGWELKNGFLYTKYIGTCSCPMLEGVNKLPFKTWCYCTVGYNKEIFKHVFGCDVEIELLKSIKMGDDICLMKIDVRKVKVNRE